MLQIKHECAPLVPIVKTESSVCKEDLCDSEMLSLLELIEKALEPEMLENVKDLGIDPDYLTKLVKQDCIENHTDILETVQKEKQETAKQPPTTSGIRVKCLSSLLDTSRYCFISFYQSRYVGSYMYGFLLKLFRVTVVNVLRQSRIKIG